MDILFIRSIFCENRPILIRRKDCSKNIFSTWTFIPQEYVHMKIRGPNSVFFVEQDFKNP